MSDRIRLNELRAAAELEIDDQGDLAAFESVRSADVLALVEAVAADIALTKGEDRGIDLDPTEHRELIARHDRALSKFDFGPDA